MAKLPRWLRNDGLQTYQTTNTFDIDPDLRRRDRRRFEPEPIEHDFSITVNIGGFTGVGVPWEGTSHDDVRDSFLEFLFNHEEFGIGKEAPHKFFRSMRVNFNGRWMVLTFRTSWITGFTVGQ